MTNLQNISSFALCLITVPLAFYAGPRFIEKHERHEEPVYDWDGYLRTPGNMTATMEFPNCPEAKELQSRMVDYNGRHAWELVTFKSKEGQHGQQVVNLTAWWLPARSRKAPRIVLQHGMNVNNNEWSVHIPAYYLRTMGFSVLLPNLRDHGLSERTKHASISWAWDYFLDVAAAWEYAVNDPDGKLGGKIGADKVGLFGLSMGGYAAASAFGLLKDAPALWLDSPVFRAKECAQFRMAQLVGDFLAWAAIEPAWSIAKWQSGVDLDGFLPEVALTNSSRPVAVVHDKSDMIVPWSQSAQYIEHFKKEGYDVKEEFIVEEPECGGFDHVSVQVVQAEEYYKRLCHFWSDAFKVRRPKCKLTSLKIPHRQAKERWHAWTAAGFFLGFLAALLLAVAAVSLVAHINRRNRRRLHAADMHVELAA